MTCQNKFAPELLEETSFLGATPSLTPIVVNHKLSRQDTLVSIDATYYHYIIDKLVYLSLTRSNIAYHVHILSQFMENPKKMHPVALEQLFKYIKQAPVQDLFFPSKINFVLRAYNDNDWGGCSNMRHSMISFCIFYDAPVSWKSTKQTKVSRISIVFKNRTLAYTT